MVLSSQAPRVVGRSKYMASPRRRRRGRGIALLVVAVIGGGVAWGLFGRSDAPEDGVVQDDGGETHETTVDRALASRGNDATLRSDTAHPTARESEPRIPVITLGGATRDASVPSAPAAPPAPRTSTDADAARTQPAGERSAEAVRVPNDAPSRDSERDWNGPGSGILDGQPLPGAESGGQTGGQTGVPGSRREGTTGRQSGNATGPLQDALSLVRSDPVEARRRLTQVVLDPASQPAERARAREELRAVNDQILFSPLVLPNDPFIRTYTVQSGDTLQRIARSQKLDADWRLLMRVNGIADERRVRLGQTLKLVTGAFHAVVSKSEYRMDVFLGESEDRVLVASFPVGLGEYNSTPTGRFKLRTNSKLINPSWVNPRTGERFAADDPKNPIGERWIGLEGIDPANRDVEGYGIHGTIEPDSIGRQASMGCVRMLHDDVVLVYELLTEPNSTVLIVD